MKYCWLIVILAGCGDDEVKRPIIYQDEPRCLSCGYVPPIQESVDTDPIPHLSAEPSELMFYYFLDSPYPFPPSSTRIYNLTDQVVTITTAYIKIGTFGGIPCSNSFEIINTTFPQILQSGESGTIWINFLWTTEITSATLKVVTDFVGLAETDVELSGKVFPMTSDGL